MFLKDIQFTNRNHPTMMRAVLMKGAGLPNVLHLGDAIKPAPKANEVLIRVIRTAVNRADISQRRVIISLLS